MRPRHAGTFHVTARSIAEEHIFRDHRDYHHDVQIIAALVTEGFLVCHGFCFMPTHYHLIASFEDDKLAPAVRRLNRRYAGSFNRRHGRRGHVFDSPYTASKVVQEGHAYRLPDYVAENPPRRPWPWSSFDVPFSFVQPLPWVETRESGSAMPNQVRC